MEEPLKPEAAAEEKWIWKEEQWQKIHFAHSSVLKIAKSSPENGFSVCSGENFTD